MNISVIVRTHNDGLVIEECLNKVFSQKLSGDVEYILVDEKSEDDTLRKAKAFSFNKVVSSSEFNAAITLNKAYSLAKGSVIINVLGHTVPVDNYVFDRLVSNLKMDDIGAVYGRQLPHPKGDSFLNVLFSLGYTEKPAEKKFLSLALSATKKALWDKVPFEEEFVPAEDKAWSIAMRKLGFKIMYEPKAAALHFHKMDLKRIFIRNFKMAKAHKKIGISKLRHYSLIHYAFLNDVRYLEKKYLLFFSPI